MQQVIQGGDNVYKQILCDVINYRYNIVFKILNWWTSENKERIKET